MTGIDPFVAIFLGVASNLATAVGLSLFRRWSGGRSSARAQSQAWYQWLAEHPDDLTAHLMFTSIQITIAGVATLLVLIWWVLAVISPVSVSPLLILVMFALGIAAAGTVFVKSLGAAWLYWHVRGIRSPWRLAQAKLAQDQLDDEQDINAGGGGGAH